MKVTDNHKVGERIKLYLSNKNINTNKFEDEIGASGGFLANTIKGDREIGSGKLSKILNIYRDINPVWLITGEGDMLIENKIMPLGDNKLSINTNSTYKIPILGNASAGYIVGYSQEEQQLYLEYHQMSVHLEQLTRGFTVYGDSMMFALADKDIVFCRRVVDVKNHLFKQDSIYVLVCSDGVTVKHLKKKDADGGFELIPENSRYRTYFLANEEILEIWKAEAKLSNLF